LRGAPQHGGHGRLALAQQSLETLRSCEFSDTLIDPKLAAGTSKSDG